MNLSNNTYLASGGRSHSADSGLSGIRNRLLNLVAWWTGRRTREREMRELCRFSDRELWDVGLSRSDVMSIENGTYRRE